jgi:hypothetical protein
VGEPPYEGSQAFKAFGPPDLVAEVGLRLSYPCVALSSGRNEVFDLEDVGFGRQCE